MLATPELIHDSTQASRLCELLPRWISEVPLYTDLKGALDLAGIEGVMKRFQQIPQITKHDIRRNFPHNFLMDSRSLDDLVDDGLVELEHTSGTSEARTPLILGLGWWAEQEERALRLNQRVADLLDAYPEARRLTLSSPVCSGDICYTGTPAKSDRIIGNTLFSSLSKHPFLWSKDQLARIAEEAAEWQPQFLDVDPVYGLVFARYCEQQGIRFPSLRFVICSYEFLSITHRTVLERVFGVPVYNLYGSTETGHLLMEDESGNMRPSLETAYLEIVQPDDAGVGPLVVTTLTNDYMPLIRYCIGDLAERRMEGMRSVYRIHGRTADAVTTTSGTRATVLQIDECFRELPGFAHYQLMQQSNREWLLRYVPDRNSPTMGAIAELRQRLQSMLGDSEVTIESTDVLMPENSGKFRLVYTIQA